jgi:hypothetical protein
MVQNLLTQGINTASTEAIVLLPKLPTGTFPYREDSSPVNIQKLECINHQKISTLVLANSTQHSCTLRMAGGDRMNAHAEDAENRPECASIE